MDYLNRKYVIFDVSELDKVNFNDVFETSVETVRKSADGTKTFVKWEGDTPAFMEEITSKSKEYTHDEILEILAGEDWTPPMSIDSSEA
jgi:uncharacterized protein YhfF